MSELGRLLREARTAKELSPADIESVTRIRQKYIEALESGDFASLPRGAVARGFLRTYAVFLGLDVADILERYGKESGDVSDDVEIADPGKPRLADYRPLEVTLSEPAPISRWWPGLIAAILVVGIIAAALWWLNRSTGFNILNAFGPAPTAITTATQTATPWVVTATPRPTTAAAALPSPTSDLLTLPTPTVPATITPTPRPTATPEVDNQIDLGLKILQRSWVRVVVDGAVAEESTFEANIEREWQAAESITVRTGNGGGVSLTLNGENLGPMGNVGQVVERTWVVDANGVVEQTAGSTRTPTATATPAPPATPTPTPAG